jgi:hypothetical protein
MMEVRGSFSLTHLARPSVDLVPCCVAIRRQLILTSQMFDAFALWTVCTLL